MANDFEISVTTYERVKPRVKSGVRWKLDCRYLAGWESRLLALAFAVQRRQQRPRVPLRGPTTASFGYGHDLVALHLLGHVPEWPQASRQPRTQPCRHGRSSLAVRGCSLRRRTSNFVAFSTSYALLALLSKSSQQTLRNKTPLNSNFVWTSNGFDATSAVSQNIIYKSRASLFFKIGVFFMNPPYIIYISKKKFGGQSDRIFLSFSAERKNFVYFLFLFYREEFLRWIVRVQAAKNVKVGSTRMTIITSCVNENYKN